MNSDRIAELRSGLAFTPDGQRMELSPLESALSDALDEIDAKEAAKNGAYSERNKTVAALAFMAGRAGFKAGIRQHDGADWEDDWRTVLFIELPTGQVSWHFHDSEAGLLKGLPEYDGEWDGHSPGEKYERLGLLRA